METEVCAKPDAWRHPDTSQFVQWSEKRLRGLGFLFVAGDEEVGKERAINDWLGVENGGRVFWLTCKDSLSPFSPLEPLLSKPLHFEGATASNQALDIIATIVPFANLLGSSSDSPVSESQLFEILTQELFGCLGNSSRGLLFSRRATTWTRKRVRG